MKPIQEIFLQNIEILHQRFPSFALLGFLYKKRVSFSVKKKPLQSIDTWFLSLDTKDTNVLFLHGIGACGDFSCMEKWLEQKATRAVVFLIDDIISLQTFLACPSSCSMVRHNQVFFYFLEKNTYEETLFTIAEKFPLGKIEVQPFLSSKSKIDFIKIQKALTEACAIKRAQFLDRYHSAHHFHNFVSNLPKFVDSFFVNKLQEAWQNIPVIICGAGPSLEEDIFLLRQMKDKAIIIAVGSATAILAKNSVDFHLAVAIDPNEEEYKRIKQAGVVNASFLYSLRLFSRCFQCLGSNLGYIKSGAGGIFELLVEEKLHMLSPYMSYNMPLGANSVTCLCLALGYFLGCDPIIFCGVDLAFQEKKAYAQDLYIEKQILVEEREKTVEDVDKNNKTILTTYKWQQEKQALEDYIKTCQNRIFLNASKGLFIEGMQHMSLQKIKEKYLLQQFDISGILHVFLQQCKIDLSYKEKIQSFLQECHKSLKRCDHFVEQILQNKENTGKRILAEEELKEEMAYKYFFYDWQDIASLSFSQKKQDKNFAFLRKSIKSYLQKMSLLC